MRGALCFAPAVAVANVYSLQDQRAKACWWAPSRRTMLKGCDPVGITVFETAGP